MKNIMIKSAIATAVVAATTATTVADVKVYGRLRMAAICVDSGNDATDDCSTVDGASRFGFKASSEISDGLTAFGRYEFRVVGDTASLGVATGAAQRLSYVGLKGGFGEISMGSRWSPLYTHTVSYNDPTNAFGGTWDNGYGYNTDFRNAETLNYKNKFGAASVGLQLQMNSNTGEDIDEMTIGASFKVGSATIGVGYQDNTDNYTIAAIHARSKFGPIGAAITYSTRDNDSAASPDNDALALHASYGMGGGKKVTVLYGQTDIDGGATPNSIGLEYNHNLGGGMQWQAGFDIQDDDLGGDDKTRYGVGLRYDF